MQNKGDMAVLCVGDFIGSHIEGELFDLETPDVRRGLLTATGRYVHLNSDGRTILILRNTRVRVDPTTTGRRVLVCDVKGEKITLCSELDPVVFENGDIHRIVVKKEEGGERND